MKKIICVGIAILLAASSVSLMSCGTKTETVTMYGRFYTLQEAYDNNLLVAEDYEYIAKNWNTPENYVPLNEKDMEMILHDHKQLHPVSSDYIEIKNAGNYNGSTVIRITDMFYGNAFDPIPENRTYFVRNAKKQVVARGPNYFWWLRVWKEYEAPTEVEKPQRPYGAFYSLQKAYENGFITKDELLLIVDEKCERDVGFDLETQEKIKSDYLSLGIEVENYLETYQEVLNIIYVGHVKENIVVRIDNYFHRDEWMEWFNEYRFDFDGISFTDTMPLKIVWRPLDYGDR